MAIHPAETTASDSDATVGTRWLAAIPWAAVAALAAVVTLTVLATDNSDTISEPDYPSEQLNDPIAPWIFAYGWPAIWLTVLAVTAVRFARTRTLPMPSMLFLAGTTMFWIEWPADWGSYLVYNRDFMMFPGWTSTWYQTYWKPVGVLFGYGVFFGVESLILLHVVPRVKAGLQRLLPGASPIALLVATCLGLFYVVDILGERLMTAAGWYSYVEPVGPAWTSDHGSISFVWPALPFLIFAVAITLTLRAGEDGFYPTEKLFRLDRLYPGPAREFARLAVWIVTMNVAIFIAQPLILVLGRIIFLHDSAYVP